MSHRAATAASRATIAFGHLLAQRLQPLRNRHQLVLDTLTALREILTAQGLINQAADGG